MALTHQLLSEPGDHSLSATVKLGRNGLGQWGNLRNPHQDVSSNWGVGFPRLTHVSEGGSKLMHGC